MRMGIGLSGFYYWQSDDKVVNLMDAKSRSSAKSDPSIPVDAGWFPTSLASGQVCQYIPATEGYTKPGRYRLIARGSGTINFAHDDIPPAGRSLSCVSAGGDAYSTLGEWDFSTSTRSILTISATDPANHLRDIVLYRLANDPAQVYTPAYIAELSKFDTLRVASMPSVIASPITDWPADDANPAGYVAQIKAGIDICSLAGCNAWISIPHMATEGYVRELARQVKARLKAGLKAYLEYSDEIWNWGGPFGVATGWVRDWTAANLGTQYTFQHGHAYLAARAMAWFVSEAPDVPVVRVIANQHMNPENFRQNLEMVNSKGLTFASGVPPVPATGLKFDAVATGPYADPRDGGLDWAAIDPLLAAGDAASKDKATQLVFDAYNRSVPLMDGAAQSYKAMADKQGYRLVTYECAPGWEMNAAEPQARLDLLQSSYRDPRMKTFLSNVYFPWMAKYFDLAMYTQYIDKSSTGKFWGVRSTCDEVPCPKWDACLDWIAHPQITAIVPPTPPAQVGLGVADAGFEQVAVGAGQFKYAPAGSPWTFAGGGGVSGNGSGFTSGNPAAPEGTQVAFLQGTGTMSQAVDLAAGKYVLKFKAAQRGNNGGSHQDVKVLVDGVVVGTFTPAGTAFEDCTTAAFTVTGHTITFQGGNTAGGDNTAFIDQVAIVAATTS